MTVAWITGAKGFVGRHLARSLSRKGIKVSGIGHGAWVVDAASQWGITHWINGEVTQSNFDRLASQTGLPEMVFHLAGGSSVGVSFKTPEEDFRRSVDSTVQLLEWIRNNASRTRLVLASSAAIYGASHSEPIPETGMIQPYSPYGYHKRISELLLESSSASFGLFTAVVRLFSIYGPELRKQLLWDLCNRLKASPSEITLAGSGQETRDWLYVCDAVEYLCRAAELADSKCFMINGGRGIGVTVQEIVEIVRDAWGLETEIIFNGQPRTGDPHYLVADIGLTKSIMPTAKTDLPTGIGEYVKWFRQREGGQLK